MASIDLPAVILTTDGASIGNPGAGGWAVLLEYGTTERLLSGPMSDSCTNNQAELQAVIAGLKALKKPCAVTLRADSQYVLHGMQQLLDGRPLAPTAKNADLWQQLAQLMALHTFTLTWVKGHAGDPRNERVDQAATAEAQAVLESSPAYQAHQQHLAGIIESLQLTARWTLVVAAPPAVPTGRWRLYTPDDIVDGTVRARNPAIAAWRALIGGLDVAAARSEDADEPAALDVLTNAEILVNQTGGVWTVAHPALVPLFAEWEALTASFTEVGVLRAADSQVVPLVTDPVESQTLPPVPAPQRTAPVSSPPPAPQQGGEPDAAGAIAWTLVVRSGRPVRWRLTMGVQTQEGEVLVGDVTEPVAVWQACLDGLAAAVAHPGAAQTAIQVLTNYDLVVKQANGIWQVKSPEIQALRTQLRNLQQQMPGMTLTWIQKDALAQLPGAPT